MNEMGENMKVKCFVCGAGPEGLTRYDGNTVVSVCEFKPDLKCPKCNENHRMFLHDDVPDAELWHVCGICDYMEHVGG